MSDATAATDERLTADEFLSRYGDRSGVELVDGRVVWGGKGPATGGGAMPRFKHGLVCQNVALLIGGHVKANALGRVAINDTFVPVGGDPPAVRGADLLFVSFARLPADQTPDDLTVPPDLVVEVKSPSDRIAAIGLKANQYLAAGVRAVVVCDPQSESVAVHLADELPYRLHNGDEFALPDVLPGFAVPVRAFFG